jgi:hypothetical protein
VATKRQKAKAAKSYSHPEAVALMRAVMGTQARLKKREPKWKGQ